MVLLQEGRDDTALRELGNYLSTLGVARCDVVVLDASSCEVFESNGRILRWVARHIAVQPEHRSPSAWVDPIRAAALVASNETVIVAPDTVRYAPEAIAKICELLETHEVVEPQDYLAPLPWWGCIDAGGLLLHRGVDPRPEHGATFGFRRGLLRHLHSLGTPEVTESSTRRLANAGAEVFGASNVFVRREAGSLEEWMTERPRSAADDFAMPVKSAFFFSVAPLLLLVTLLGEPRFAATYAAILATASIALALRGRLGASNFFPLRACLFAPLWIAERSLSVYWALFRKIRGTATETAASPATQSVQQHRQRSA